MLRESATLGVRMHHAERLKAGRRGKRDRDAARAGTRQTEDGGRHGYRRAPEYDDCRALAQRLGLPMETVMARVAHAARTHFKLDDANQEE